MRKKKIFEIIAYIIGIGAIIFTAIAIIYMATR